ncbi:protein kinase domain-containing protein [Cryptosporidium serpentis]
MRGKNHSHLRYNSVLNQDDFEEIEEIGRGCFGTVHRIRRKSDGKVYVWKKMCYENMSQLEKTQIVTEVNVLRKLNHRNITKYIDRIVDRHKQYIYIIMEHCDQGDLGTFLKRSAKRKLSDARTKLPEVHLSEDDLISIFVQLLDALDYCHTRNTKVLHRDIKPQNIFLIIPDKIHSIKAVRSYEDKLRKSHTTDFGFYSFNAIVKLGDFGLAKCLTTQQFATTHVGTPYYMSPEVLSKGEYNEKSDIWSLGCCMYEVMTGEPPFYAKSYEELREHVSYGPTPTLPNYYSNEIGSVLSLMFEKDPVKRPTALQLLNHPYIQKKRSEFYYKWEYLFLLHEYYRVVEYSHFLESYALFKNDYAESENSTLDTSRDSSKSDHDGSRDNYYPDINQTSYKISTTVGIKNIKTGNSSDFSNLDVKISSRPSTSQYFTSNNITTTPQRTISSKFAKSPKTLPCRYNSRCLKNYLSFNTDISDNLKYPESSPIHGLLPKTKYSYNSENNRTENLIIQSERRLSMWVERFNSRSRKY